MIKLDTHASFPLTRTFAGFHVALSAWSRSKSKAAGCRCPLEGGLRRNYIGEHEKQTHHRDEDRTVFSVMSLFKRAVWNRTRALCFVS